MATVAELDVRVSSHEAGCKIRHESINARLKRIEQIGVSVAASIIALLIHIIMKT
tara:strand:+ start:200 stop:364 length:165 start_codon:yes stop_codon:yes gene_type:complete